MFFSSPRQYRIEMHALIQSRAPSACSIASMANECEEISFLPGSDDDIEQTHTPCSNSQALGTGQADSQDYPHPDRLDCNKNATEQRTDLQNKRDPVEEPKSIWTKNRKRAFLFFLVLHFVPVAITLILFWLYLGNFQWRANDLQLKALLFAAKLHESTILVSLGDILFHRIRYHLLTSRGISFGLLVSPFRFSTPFSLVQAPFVASARYTLRSGPEFATVLLIVLVSTLAMLAAPSSGVLMLPRYAWWQISNDDDIVARFKKQDLDDASYIGAPYEDLFPSLIDGRFGPDKIRDDRLDTPSLSNRFEQMIDRLDLVLIDGSSGANANITVLDGATLDSFTLAYQEQRLEDCELSTCAYLSKIRNTTVADVKKTGSDCVDSTCLSVSAQATSPLAIVTQKLFDRYRTLTSETSSMFMISAQPFESGKEDLTWKQPSVSMQCSTVLYNGPTKLPAVSFQHFGSFPAFSFSLDRALLDHILEAEAGVYQSATYVDISRLLPAGITVSTALLMSGAFYGLNETYLCLVDARWIESHIWFTAPYTSIMRSGLSMESVQTSTGSNTTMATSPVINITTEFANSLDANLTVASSYGGAPGPLGYDTPFAFIQMYCFMRVDTQLHLGPKCAMLAHTLYLTDSLRRTQSFFRYQEAAKLRFSQTLPLLEPEKWTKLDYRLYHQLHAYKFEGAIIKLSMSVLLVHMMLVYAHLLLLVAGDGWCSRAWSELGELMALAILTRPSPLLQNAGGGVKDWQTWRLRAFVREVTPEGRLELVLKETVGSPRVLVELEEGQEKALVEPEADRRYG